MRRWVFILAFGLLLAACDNPLAAPSPTPTCAQQVAPALTQIQSVAREWDDANKLAGQTPRASLAQQISTLQAVRRKVQDIAVPDCATAMKQALVASMDASIDAYVAFLGQKPNSTVQDLFKTANDKMTLFGQEAAKLAAAPAPTP